MPPRAPSCPSPDTRRWYEDRWSTGTNRGYAVATAPTPAGPFTTVVASTTTHGNGRVGDYDLFVDIDGTGCECAVHSARMQCQGCHCGHGVNARLAVRMRAYVDSGQKWRAQRVRMPMHSDRDLSGKHSLKRPWLSFGVSSIGTKGARSASRDTATQLVVHQSLSYSLA